MKISRLIIVNLLIVFTFVGNVGMRVFTHSCKEDGVFTSYFVEAEDHCEKEEAPVHPPCCKKEAQKEKDCCDDQVDVYKINLDYYSSYDVEIPTLFVEQKLATFNFYVEPEFYTQAEISHFIHPPPKPSGLELLIQNQVFRI